MKNTGYYRERGESALRSSVKNDLSGSSLRRVSALGLKASALALFSMLFGAAAVAQTPHNWPIVNGRQLQPTQQQLESTEDTNIVEWNRWNRRVAPELDRLNDEITRAATRPEY